MRSLLLIKEQIKKFVGRTEVFIMPILKFLVTYMALSQINSKLGFMPRLNNSAITLIIALAGSFLPLNLTLVILAAITVAHVFALSFEACIVVLVLFLVMFLLYFRFSSGDAIAVMLVPLSFIFKIPYVIPVSMGLVGTPGSMVSTACGVIVYHVLHYISVNADSLKSVNAIDESKIGTFKEVADAILVNKSMLVLAIAFAVTVLIVYIIRRLSVSYAWTIAIAFGSLSCFVLVLLFNSALGGNVSGGEAFVGIIISLILNVILQYFLFDLDYNRVEKVQFEDDEYYYYVKAVPKNTIKLSDNGKKRKAPAKRPQASAPVRKQEEEAPVRKPAERPVQARRPQAPVHERVQRPLNPANARDTVRLKASQAARTGAQKPQDNGIEDIRIKDIKD